FSGASTRDGGRIGALEQGQEGSAPGPASACRHRPADGRAERVGARAAGGGCQRGLPSGADHEQPGHRLVPRCEAAARGRRARAIAPARRGPAGARPGRLYDETRLRGLTDQPHRPAAPSQDASAPIRWLPADRGADDDAEQRRRRVSGRSLQAPLHGQDTMIRGLSAGAAAVAVAAVAAIAWASWTTPASAGSKGGATAATVNQGATPSVNVTSIGREVAVSWGAATLSNGAPVGGYLVNRYPSGGGSAALSTIGSCTGTVTSTSCVEDDVPAGTWRYTITPVLGVWHGAESLTSGVVTMAAAALTVNGSPFG